MSFAVHKKDGKTGSANIVSVVICALHYIIAGVIIVNQNSIWRFLDTAGAYFNEITALILTGAVVISMILNLYLHRKRKNAVKFMAVGLVCVYMSIFGVLNNFLAFYYFEFVLTAVMIGIYYFICNTDQIPEFFRAYRNIILVIAAVSLVMWLLCSVFRLIPYTAKVYTCWTDNGELKRIKSYLGIYFEPQKITLFGASFRRNCACFAEGPQAGLAFTLGYLIELFLTEKSSKVRLIIFSLAIISTFSVTGIIVMALAFIVWILIKHHAAIRKSNGLKAGLAASGVAILALLVYLVIVNLTPRQ